MEDQDVSAPAIHLKAPYDAAIVSDLHLRAGPGDDFLFDRQFEGMLQDLWRDGCREIILNGDIFEFVAMWPESPLHPDPSLGFTQGESLARMVAIGLEHGLFFEALRRFVRDGGRCVFLPGNHDWDLHWPQVQAHLRELLGDPTGARTQFVLHGQAYQAAGGRLHVEHGHQLVGDQNLFHHPMQPLRPDPRGGPRRLEQPIGNWLVRSLVNPLEAHFPFINNVRPFAKIGWGGAGWHTARLLTVLPTAILQLLEDGRIPRRLLDAALSSGPLRHIFGQRQRWPSRRREFMPSDIAGMLGDDSSQPMQMAARRHLQLRNQTRYIVMGHSHEFVDKEHAINEPFARRGRGYLNPGCWNPCREVPEDAAPLPLDELLTGSSYPYKLGLVRARQRRNEGLEAQLEIFDEGEVWMKAA